MSQELKPCPNPWCEGKEGVETSVHASGRWHVCCDDCMIEGPWANTQEEAEAMWNTRPNPLLEEAERALEQIADAPAWGYPERWETTPAEVRQLARATLSRIRGE